MTERSKTIRLVKAVKIRHPEYSLRQIRELIAAGHVSVDGQTAKERSLVAQNSDIVISVTPRQALTPNPNVPCRILKKTRDYLFLEKAAGVHAVAHDFEETNSVANWLLSVDPSLTNLDPLECGLAHRLDFETSGVMVAARNRPALEHVRTCFRGRAVAKKYVCLVTNEPPEPGHYEAFAGKHTKSAKRIRIGKRGIAKAEILTEILAATREGKLWRVTVRLVTGYRHQIRAHLAFLGSPIVGDAIYGGKDAKRLMLHAERLAFESEGGTLAEAESPAPF
jgi:23S rRNA pseudouridine1911/1915/1917 synthase